MGVGGREDEPGLVGLRRPQLWSGPGVWHVGRIALDPLCPSAGACRPDSGRRRGRPPQVGDEALLEAIREVRAEAERLGFCGEGYRKVWARLRYRGIRVSRERVRLTMRRHGLRAAILGGRGAWSAGA